MIKANLLKYGHKYLYGFLKIYFINFIFYINLMFKKLYKNNIFKNSYKYLALLKYKYL